MNPLAAENAAPAAATLAGLGGALATTGLDPLTGALIILFGGVVRQLMASSAALITANQELRTAHAVREHALRDLERTVTRALHDQPTRALEGAAGSIAREREQHAEDARG